MLKQTGISAALRTWLSKQLNFCVTNMCSEGTCGERLGHIMHACCYQTFCLSRMFDVCPFSLPFIIFISEMYLCVGKDNIETHILHFCRNILGDFWIALKAFFMCCFKCIYIACLPPPCCIFPLAHKA